MKVSLVSTRFIDKSDKKGFIIIYKPVKGVHNNATKTNPIRFSILDILAQYYIKKYRIRYMRAPHMLFFSVKVFEKVGEQPII